MSNAVSQTSRNRTNCNKNYSGYMNRVHGVRRKDWQWQSTTNDNSPSESNRCLEDKIAEDIDAYLLPKSRRVDIPKGSLTSDSRHLYSSCENLYEVVELFPDMTRADNHVHLSDGNGISVGYDEEDHYAEIDIKNVICDTIDNPINRGMHCRQNVKRNMINVSICNYPDQSVVDATRSISGESNRCLEDKIAEDIDAYLLPKSGRVDITEGSSISGIYEPIRQVEDPLYTYPWDIKAETRHSDGYILEDDRRQLYSSKSCENLYKVVTLFPDMTRADNHVHLSDGNGISVGYDEEDHYAEIDIKNVMCDDKGEFTSDHRLCSVSCLRKKQQYCIHSRECYYRKAFKRK